MKNNNKYTIVCEGETEEYLFQSLKTTIFKNKRISQCKEHKQKAIKGTINSKSYISDKTCCNVIYIIDKDNLTNNEILKHKKMIKERNGENGYLIISNPCIEIILLAIFENNINASTLLKKNLNDRLTKKLILNRIINKNEKYSKSNNSVLEKIIKFLEKDEDYVKEWINNVSNLKFKEEGIEFNNFDVVIEFLKGDK